MKKEFVPYEIAIKLKEKGFNLGCLAYFVNDQFRLKKYLSSKDANYNSDFTIGNLFSAPLWQQVIDWFREKHNLIIWVEARYGFEKKYLWFIHFDVLIKDDIFDLHIEKYEEARQAAIEHALTLI